MKSGKRVYIAAKLNKMEDQVNALKRRLESLGYEIIYDWTTQRVERPFGENVEGASRAAEAMARAVMNCDIFIFLYSEGGIGYHIETGGAMVASMILSFITGEAQKPIYMIGEEGYERSVFYYHRSVTRVPNVEAFFDALASANSSTDMSPAAS